jgi:hypothetical protein
MSLTEGIGARLALSRANPVAIGSDEHNKFYALEYLIRARAPPRSHRRERWTPDTPDRTAAFSSLFLIAACVGRPEENPLEKIMSVPDPVCPLLARCGQDQGTVAHRRAVHCGAGSRFKWGAAMWAAPWHATPTPMGPTIPSVGRRVAGRDQYHKDLCGAHGGKRLD